MREGVRKKEPSVLKTTWPAFAAVFGLVAVAAGVVAMERSMQDYHAPPSLGGGHVAVTAFR